jgi:hypothetical protein
VSHEHWCEIGQHEWECDGTQAVRVWAGETEPTPCEAVPDNGIELVSCPEHLEEDRRRFAAGKDLAEVLQAYQDIIWQPEDTPEYKEAIRMLRAFIEGRAS